MAQAKSHLFLFSFVPPPPPPHPRLGGGGGASGRGRGRETLTSSYDTHVSTIGGNCHNTIFVATTLCLSRQKRLSRQTYFCHDKTFCLDKYLSRQKLCLSRQAYFFSRDCRDKTRILWRQIFCPNKTFAAASIRLSRQNTCLCRQKTFLSRQKKCLSRQKLILVTPPANDTKLALSSRPVRPVLLCTDSSMKSTPWGPAAVGSHTKHGNQATVKKS